MDTVIHGLEEWDKAILISGRVLISFYIWYNITDIILEVIICQEENILIQQVKNLTI